MGAALPPSACSSRDPTAPSSRTQTQQWGSRGPSLGRPPAGAAQAPGRGFIPLPADSTARLGAARSRAGRAIAVGPCPPRAGGPAAGAPLRKPLLLPARLPAPRHTPRPAHPKFPGVAAGCGGRDAAAPPRTERHRNFPGPRGAGQLQATRSEPGPRSHGRGSPRAVPGAAHGHPKVGRPGASPPYLCPPCLRSRASTALEIPTPGETYPSFARNK